MLKKSKVFSTEHKWIHLSDTQKIDMLFMISLGYIVFLVRTLFLQNYAPAMFDIDSYRYFYEAASIYQDNKFTTNPFIAFLSLLYPLADNSNLLLFLRNVNLIFSIQLVLFFYLIAKKMFNQIISFVAAMMMSFTYIFMAYSVTLHNDVFALSMGLASLYFSIRPSKLIHIIIASVFIILTGLTRPDTFIVFIMPFIIGLSNYVSSKLKRSFYLIFALLLTISMASAVMVGQNYYYSTTRFNPVEKVILFFTYDNAIRIWQKSVEITTNETLNQLFLSIAVAGTIIAIYNFTRKISSFKKGIHQITASHITGIYLICVFLVSFITVTSFHISYSIVNDNVVFSDRTVLRYLMGLQFILIVPFTYALSLLTNIPSSVRNIVTDARKN